MKFEEALAAMREGKKITRGEFKSSEFITLVNGNLLGNDTCPYYVPHDFVCDDGWEIYTERVMDLPKIGSEWHHIYGDRYRVIALANTHTTRPEKYPVMVVYESARTSYVWCRKADDWYGSMSPISTKETS